MKTEVEPVAEQGDPLVGESRVMFLLSVIDRGVRRHLDQQIKAHIDPALSISHADILMYLRLNGRATVSELQRFLGVTKSTMTALAAKLDKLGYVRRRVDVADRRVTWIEPARDLDRRLRGAKAIGAETRAALLKDFSDTEARQLVALLGRLKANLENLG